MRSFMKKLLRRFCADAALFVAISNGYALLALGARYFTSRRGMRGVTLAPAEISALIVELHTAS